MSTCIRCGNPMTATRGDWNYSECGLDNVVLEEVEVRECGGCGARSVVVPNVEGLHAMIAALLAIKPVRLLPGELRFLRQYLGFSKDDLAPLLGVEPSDIASFEAGKRAIPLQLENHMRLRVLSTHPVGSYAPSKAEPRRHLAEPPTDEQPPPIAVRQVKKRRWEPGYAFL